MKFDYDAKKQELVCSATRRPEGLYRCERIKGDTREVLEDTGWFHNLITDRGLDYMCSLGTELSSRPSSWLRRCIVGTGSATPDPTDLHLAGTILGTMIAAGQPQQGAWVPTPEYYLELSQTFEFPVGAVVGNVAEIGVGPSNLTTTAPYDDLGSRALVEVAGAPGTLTLESDEILRVYYKLRLYMDMSADSTYDVDISGVTYSVTMRPCELGGAGKIYWSGYFYNNTGGNFTYTAILNSTQTLAAKTDRPSTTGGTLSYNATGVNTYAIGDHYRDYILSANTGQANFSGGIGSAVFGNWGGCYQMSFTPKIPKDNLKVMTLTFRNYFARY